MPHVRPSNAWRFLRTLWLGAWLAGWALLAQAQQLAPVPEFGARVVDQSGVLTRRSANGWRPSWRRWNSARARRWRC